MCRLESLTPSGRFVGHGGEETLDINSDALPGIEARAEYRKNWASMKWKELEQIRIKSIKYSTIHKDLKVVSKVLPETFFKVRKITKHFENTLKTF